jgi:RNA-directed DNA polymerase
VNTGAPWPSLAEARTWVLGIQAKLHQWATDDPDRRFADLFNLVADPATLTVAWARVRGNRGARTAGVDGVTAHYITAVRGEEQFLADLRADLKAGRFDPLPVRQRMIPKSSGVGRRRLGIPTVRDRVVQAALLTVLEPIWEADFKPCSYGFRPGRRAHDAIAEVRHFADRSYEWIVEGDIEACFDHIDHAALTGRVRRRVADKRVLTLVKAFLKSGILHEDGTVRDTNTGTPQGGILSPLLSNIALAVLDEHFAEAWTMMGHNSGARQQRRKRGLATYRLVRYADDWVALVSGTRAHAEAVQREAAEVLAPMGLRLSAAKTRITHIDEGLTFLGYRIQRQLKRGTNQRYVYTFPPKTALAAVKAKVRALTQGSTHQTLEVLLHRLNPVLRGWTAYHRHGSAKATFSYLRAFVWRRVMNWLRHKHGRISWRVLRRRYLDGWWPVEGETRLFNPGGVRVEHYRYRGSRIPSPWTGTAGSGG